MALYRHVRNKDDLLVAVVDVLLERLGVPEPGRDWRAWLEALALGLRRLLVEHPVAVAVFSRAPVTTPAARRRLNAAVEVLGQAGFSRDGAVRAYAAVHTYTVGFCALEAARYSGAVGPLPGSVDDESMLIGTFVSDDQFTHGLGALLRGLSPET